MLTGTDFIQNLRCYIFMPHRVILFPYIQMLFSNREQYRNILLRYHMPFSENCVFYNAGNDLCNVMAEYTSDRFFCLDQFHIFSHFPTHFI